MATGATEYVDSTLGNGVWVPDLWSAEALVAMRKNLVFAENVNRQWEKEATIGKSVYVPSVSHLDARAKVENTAITFQTNTETAVQILIDKWYYAAFGIEKMVRKQGKMDIVAKYQNELGYALAKQVDSDLAALVPGLSQTVGTLGTNLSDDNLRRAKQYLDDADVPLANRVIVINPAEENNFLSFDRYTSADYVNTNTPVLNGEIGKLYGVPVLKTTNLNAPSAGQAACVMMHKEAFALVIQSQPDTHMDFSISHLADQVAMEIIYGVKEMRDDHGVYLRAKG